MPSFAPITLNTERLALRFFEEGDAAALYAIFSDVKVMRYWSSSAWTTMEEAHESVREAQAAYTDGSSLRLGIVLRDSGELIGYINLYAIYHANRRCDIGYALAQPHWGNGYLAEAMRAVIEHGFAAMDLNRIEADIDPRNTASEKLLERMGFQKEGYMRERWIVNGEICDTAFYGLLRSEWKMA
ncbi:MAG: GNAT family protein [Pseudomonadota bacterium]